MEAGRAQRAGLRRRRAGSVSVSVSVSLRAPWAGASGSAAALITLGQSGKGKGGVAGGMSFLISARVGWCTLPGVRIDR